MKFYIIRINCSSRTCGDHFEARRRIPSGYSGFTMCQHCGTNADFTEWKFIKTIQANNQFEAVDKFMNIFRKKRSELKWQKLNVPDV